MSFYQSYRFWIIVFLIVTGIFFQQTIRFGKLPVPSDTLVGLYHPWRDAWASEYPRGIPYKNFLITDPIRQQIPWRKLAVESLRKGTVPLWNPTAFSGMGLLGNIQSGSLYPLNILFFILPFDRAWTFLIIIQVIGSGVFFLLYAANLKLHPVAGFVGALAWSFSGFSVAWLTWGTMVQAAMWLPLILLAIDNWREEKNKLSALLISGALAMSFLAGHSQIFFYVFLLSAWYGLIRCFRPANTTAQPGRISYLLGLLSAVLLFVTTTSVQWLSLAHSLVLSTRIGEINGFLKDGWFVPYQHLLQFIAPDFFGNPATLNYWGTWNYGEMVGYIGVAALGFAILGAFSGKGLGKFWLFTLGGTLLLLLPTPLAQLIYQFQVPLLSNLQPTRMMVVVCFCLAVLAALGVQAIVTQAIRWSRMVLGLGIWMGLLVIPWILVLLVKSGQSSFIPIEVLPNVIRNLLLPTLLWFVSLPILLGLRVKKLSMLAGLLLVVVLAFDLLRFAWKFTPFTPRELFFPTTKTITFLQNQPQPFRFITTDDRLMPPNVSGYYGLASVGGYDPLSTKRYEQFIAAMERGRPDISEPLGFNRIVTPKNYLSPLFPHLAAQYVLSLTEIPGQTPVFQEGNTLVYVMPQALPRVYLVNNLITVPDGQKAIEQLYESTFRPGVDAVIEVDSNHQLDPNARGEIINLVSTDTTISLDVVADKAMFLVINNQYDPWWQVKINGTLTELLKTNFAFQGVLIPTGRHTINLTYGIHSF